MGKIIRSVCQACHCECGVMVHIEDGKVTKIKGDPGHPMSRGFTCVKGRAEPQRLYHPERLKYPLRRAGERGDGKWERISWDTALNEIARKLTEVKEKHGTESIASIHGTGPRASLCSSLLPYALGSPNRISVDLHICWAPSMVAEISTVGSSIMMDEGPDYLNSNCIVVWGGNPLEAHPPRGVEILEAKRKRRAKLIVIDPRETRLASKADMWLPVRPGTDVALALAMMNVIISEGLYDEGFVGKWCDGFDELCKWVKEYPPEKMAEITWIPADKIREVARTYATTKPAVLHHRVAIEHNVNSTQTDRALIMLIAITGNIDVKGGNLLPTHIKGYIPMAALAGGGKWLRPDREVEEKRIGGKEYPLISGPDAVVAFVTSFLAFESVLSGKPYQLKALYCAGANPVINVQKSKWVWETMKELDLTVVVDFFMTPSAQLADYVLPATTWLERDECCDLQYMNYISTRQKAVEPLYECWDDLKIEIELVKRIPWANRKMIPWEDVYECYEWMVRDTGLSFKELQKQGYIVAPIEYKKYEKEGFKTPSGKVELYSTIFKHHGYNPLPGFREPPESPVSTPEMMKEYPLILITGSRNMAFFHSEGRQISQLRKLTPDPEVEIHPDTAREINIEDGDWVWIETPQVIGERVRFRARTTKHIHPRVVHAAHGWWFPEKPAPEYGCFESNINVILSADPPREEICGSVPTRGTLCRIYK
ncbi:molybdopterin-dependent oxidoreductase [Thermodesulfobacteriota bacterium]